MASSKNKLSKVVSAPSPGPYHEDMKYRAEDALRTLVRAEEIKRDKSLMPHVKKAAREQIKSVSKVCTPKKRN